MCRVTMGHLRATRIHHRVTKSHIRAGKGLLWVTKGHLSPVGHLRDGGKDCKQNT